MRAAPGASSRASRRRPAPKGVAALRAPGFPRLPTAVWWVATLGLLVLVGLGTERKITWYLAVDQYGYLAFAHDLMHGKVFHHWAPLDALAPRLSQRVDVLVQTYVWDNGKLYCRYAPGFPLLLAGWLRLFGDDGAHYLNPTVFMALLALALAFQRRIFRSRWRATAGTVLIVLFPSLLHLWALTLTRDLATHLMGLLGLFLVLPVRGHPLRPARTLAAGLAIGFAGSIRPDEIIYAVPALLVVIARWRRERPARRAVLDALGAGALGVLIGLAPFLGYNWVATGSPLRPTQGMEIDQFLAPRPPWPKLQHPGGGGAPATEEHVGYPSPGWRGGTWAQVQGGGLRLTNLPKTLPGNIALLQGAYGNLLLVTAIWGAVVALLRRRLFFLATVPYCVLALLLFSCWGRPDTRYLTGIYVFVPMLVIEGTLGTLDLMRLLARRRRVAQARGLGLVVAAALVGGAALVRIPPQTTALPWLVLIVPGATALAACAAAAWPERRIAALAAPLLALVLVGLAAARASAGLDHRATFQRPEMLRARAAFGRVVAPGGVVITTEDVGRPAENIDYYSGVASALYLTDLERWRLSVGLAAALLGRAGMTPYLFIPASQPRRERMLATLSRVFTVTMVADIPPPQAIEYFVAAAFHRGVHMHLYRLDRRLQAPE